MDNTQRERLIEILKQGSCPSSYICDENCKYADLESCYEPRVADLLLSNGVIVPPCKVGDTVYVIGDNKVEERTIEYFVITESCVNARLSDFMEYDIDKIFLTREDAERAIQKHRFERTEGNNG